LVVSLTSVDGKIIETEQQCGETMREEVVEVGEFCPNEACEVYGPVEGSCIVRYGKTAAGVQRYQCRICGRSFTATKGTLFYRKQTARKEIVETLALLAEGTRISSISRVKGIKEDTILGWLREAAAHAAQIEAVLMEQYQVGQAQIDGMWAYVGFKGQKGAIANAPTKVNSGAVP
jgi:transposase-like protein